jgi:hypothetical protein
VDFKLDLELMPLLAEASRYLVSEVWEQTCQFDAVRGTLDHRYPRSDGRSDVSRIHLDESDLKTTVPPINTGSDIPVCSNDGISSKVKPPVSHVGIQIRLSPTHRQHLLISRKGQGWFIPVLS